MRVLQIIPEMETGGAERTTVDVARALIAGGHQAFVATARGRLIPALRNMGVTVFELPVNRKNPLVMWQSSRELKRIIRDHQIDLVHARSRACAWPAMWASQSTNTAFLTTYHGIYKARSGLKRWYNSIMARGDLVIANSAFTADHMRAEHNTDPDKIVVIPRGVDLNVFTPDHVTAERIDALRHAWGLSADSGFVILCPARLTRWKGQEVLIAALKDFPKPFTALLVGSAQGRDGYVAELSGQIAAAGLADCVRLVGHCDDIAAAYLLADVVVCPSLEPEAFGRTAAEAQAMGRIVIAAGHGGAREVVIAGETGFLTVPGDVTDLTQTLNVVQTMASQEKNTMCTKARAHVEQLFSVERMTSDTLAVYKRLVKGR